MMGTSVVTRARTILLALIASIALVIVGLSATAPAAHADTFPPSGTPATVSSDALPTVQIDGVVWTQLIVGNTVYAGGNFQNARPAGAAAGTQTVTRTDILAYNLQTGALISSFAPTLNGQVRSLAISPDGNTLYVGGSFTTVNGINKYRIAALNPVTGAVNTAFAPSVNSTVDAIVPLGSSVYIGGQFTVIGSANINRLAKLSAANGAVDPTWSPSADNGTVTSMVASPDGTKLVAGGSFTTVNGGSSPGYGLVMLSATTGAVLSLPVNNVVQDAGPNAAIESLASDSTSFYGTGYVFGSGGNLEGTFQANWSDGTIVWIEDCHGDEYSVAPANNVVYTTGHMHFCGDVQGGFPQTDPNWTFHRGLAFTKAVTGTLGSNPYGAYQNYAGTPSPTILHWYPDINTGTFTGLTQGAWSVAANSQYVLYAGEFTQINGQPQQGLVRFAVHSIAPDKDGPQMINGSFVPTVTSTSPGTARVAFTTLIDRDNANLTYSIYRDGGSTPIYTTTASSGLFNTPQINYTDTGLTPGSTHTYKVRATDPDGNTVLGTAAAVTVSTGGTTSAYANDVISDGATNFWRLADSAGSTYASDGAGSSTAVSNGVLTKAVTFGVPGPITTDGSTAATFNGTASGIVTTQNQIAGPQTFGIEAWFKTTSTGGGKIIGFGSLPYGGSNDYDRQIYMDGNGVVYFGVYPGFEATLQSQAGLNDGNWHQVVASLSSSGMTLSIDGKQVASRTDVTSAQAYNGYWRIGGDNTWTGNQYFTGSIGDVSIYNNPLSITQVNKHWMDAGNPSAIPLAPTDAYGNRVYNDGASTYWRLNDAVGSTTAADSSIYGDTGIVNGGVTFGVPGALPNGDGTAATFDGSSGYIVGSQQVSGPSVYSEELAFNTTTTNGGTLMGFGDTQSPQTNSYDRHIYMLNSGQLVFGAYTGQLNTITSSQSYNDGKWHWVVATEGPDGMNLYVDGQSVGTNPNTGAQPYNGYWRIGGNTNWGSQPWFQGTIDEAAVYPTELSSSTVAQHYALAGGTVTNQPPTASFTSSVNNLAASFNASGSTDPSGTITSYAWNFGDNTTGSGQTASHTYTAAGTYTVVLTVTDSNGLTGTSSSTVTVAPAPAQPPTASFTSSANNLAVSFDGTASSDPNPNGTISSYAWNFGDNATATGATTSHTYAAAGTYSVTLTVTDNNGLTGTSTQSVTVTAAPPPHVPPTASFTSAVSNLSVAFNASASSDPDGTITSYAWNFGDNQTGTGVNPSHTYATAGTYTVTLTVTDNTGATGTTTATVSPVNPPNQPPVASFTSSVSNLTVNVNASGSSDPDGTIASYAWNFGDQATATGVTASHTYAAAGTYTVTLTVTDNQGATSTSTASVTVTAPPATPFAMDSFSRTVSNGWGTADTGGAWSNLGSASNLSVSSGAGMIKLPAAGNTAGAYLNSVSQLNTDLRVQLSVNKPMTGGGSYLYVVGRHINNTTEYRAGLHFYANGQVGLSLSAYEGSSTGVSLTKEVLLPTTITAGTPINVRLFVSGSGPTTISAKAWVSGTTEPANWTVSTTDSYPALQAPGSIGLVNYLSGSATNAPVTVSVQQLSAFNQ